MRAGRLRTWATRFSLGVTAALALQAMSFSSALAGEVTQVSSSSFTRGIRTVRSWSHVDLWQASIEVPKDWVLVDLSATDPFPASTPTIFQLTNFDPGVADSPVCIAGRSGTPPSDAVLLTVGTGVPTNADLRPASAGKCPAPTEVRRWNENGNDYWAVVAARRDGDPARAYRVLREMALPPSGTQDTPIFANSDQPQVIWASGATESGPWIAYGDHKWQCLGEQTSGGCGAPSNAPKGDSLWSGYGTGSMGDEAHPYIGIDGIVSPRVNRVSFYDKHGERTRAQVVSVPRSLWGGRANAFVVVVPVLYKWSDGNPFKPKNGKLVLFHNSDRLGSLPL